MFSTRPLPRLALSLSALCLLGLSACNGAEERRGEAGRSGAVTSTGTAEIGGAFSLINQDGESVTQDDFLGRPHLIYFGFSYCPDICPSALQRLGRALDIVGKKADRFQPVFISIDPERDTPDDLKQYVTANGFPDNLIGLTGSQAQIDQAVAAYRVYAKRVDDPQSAAGYTMDHSSIIFLMDEDGQYVTLFADSNTPGEIAERLKVFLKKGR